LDQELQDSIATPGTSGYSKEISLDYLEPGLHSIQIRVYTHVNGVKFYSKTLFRNIFIKGCPQTLIGLSTEFPINTDIVHGVKLDRIYGMTQYVPYDICYAIYDPNAAKSSDVDVYLNDALYMTSQTSNNTVSYLSIISDKIGYTEIDIHVNGSVYTINSDVNQSSIDIYEITNPVLNLRSRGRVNVPEIENNATWESNGYTSTFTNFY
jgi:hypothetical protein